MKFHWFNKTGNAVRRSASRKIGVKITAVSTVCILVTVAATVAVMQAGSDSLSEAILESDTQAAMGSLTGQIQTMKAKSANYAKIFAENTGLCGAVESGSTTSILPIVNETKKSVQADVDFIIVTDPKGKVLIRTSGKQTGDNLSADLDIQGAEKGMIGAFLEKGSVEKLAVRAAAPIRSNEGSIAGIVSLGYSLDRSGLLDGLRQTTGCEYAVFLGNAPLNTTFLVGGKRQFRAADPASADSVLTRKAAVTGQENLMGRDYYTRYEPITDSSGKTIGVFFVGKLIANILSMKQKSLLSAILAALLFACASIAFLVTFFRKKITEPIAAMSALTARLADGDLHSADLTFSSKDEIGQLAESLRTMSASLNSYIGDISLNLSAMAAGDMTVKIEHDYVGDFAPIKEALLKISDALNRTLSQIRRSADEVNSGAGEVSSGSQLLAQGTSEQAGSVTELSGTIAKVSDTVRDTAEQIHGMAQSVTRAAEELSVSNREASEMLDAMNGIRESSDRIKKIIKSIDDIAFQTNILALNAAVEAARAGDSGKGFSVVADEVRSLAAKSAESSKETAALIEDSLEKVRNGLALADQTAKSSGQIYKTLLQVTRNIESVDQSSKDQLEEVTRIKNGMDQISSVVQTNSATAEESAAASEELFRQAELLQQQVKKFTLRE